MDENFGLLDSTVQGNDIYLMSVDGFSNWLAKASNAHQAWVAAQGFTAKPGKAITFATVEEKLILPSVFTAVTQYGMALRLRLIYPLANGNSWLTTAICPTNYLSL